MGGRGLSLGVAFLLERLDRRIREPKDLEAVYGLPLLGVVRCCERQTHVAPTASFGPL